MSSKLEDFKAEYQKNFDEGMPLIEKKLKEACELVEEAENLAEKYGLAFNTNVSPFAQSFVSDSLWEKFSDLETEESEDECFEDILDEFEIPNHWTEGSGWEHSAFC